MRPAKRPEVDATGIAAKARSDDATGAGAGAGAGAAALGGGPDVSRLQTNRGDSGSSSPNEPVTVEDEPGRNDPCPCGSGEKYKRCHGR